MAVARRSTCARTARPPSWPQEVDADTFAGLPNVLPGERAVFLNPDVILAAADKIRSDAAMGRRIEERHQRASSTRCSPASSTPPTGWKPSRRTT